MRRRRQDADGERRDKGLDGRTRRSQMISGWLEGRFSCAKMCRVRVVTECVLLLCSVLLACDALELSLAPPILDRRSLTLNG